MPVHIYSDALPEGEIAWEVSHALASSDVEVTVVSGYTELRHDDAKIVERDRINLRTIPIFSHKTTGWTSLHRVLTWCTAWPSLHRKEFDLVLFVENAPGLFARFRSGTKIAARALRSYEYDNPALAEDLWYDRLRK